MMIEKFLNMVTVQDHPSDVLSKKKIQICRGGCKFRVHAYSACFG